MSRRSSRQDSDDSIVTPRHLLALFAAKDLEALIDAAFPILRTAVDCDFVSAFYRSAGNGLFKERDSLGREYGGAFMRRYVELTPALPFAMARRGVALLCTRTILPRLAELRRRRSIVKLQDTGLASRGRAVLWGIRWEAPLRNRRIAATSDFSARTCHARAIHPFLDCAVN